MNESNDLNLGADGGADVLTRPVGTATAAAAPSEAIGTATKGQTAQSTAETTLATIGANFKAVAEQAYADFKAKLPDLQLTPAEEDDVKWAMNKLLEVGAAHVGLSDVEAAKLNQDRLDALSCLNDIEAVKAHDGQKVLLQTAAAVFARAQDVILGLVPVLVSKL